MQALLKRAGSMLRPASSCIFQTIRSMRWESKVVVEGLASTIDDRILREAFSPYGNVAEARVVVDRETGRSVGFGFVTYEDYDSCDRAVGGMHQWELHGQTVRVSWATPPGADSIDQDGSENIPISLVGRRSTSVLDRWINRGFKRELLASGMVLFKEYLTIMGQADIVNICQKRAVGPAGFFRPRSPSGHKLALKMMCYGRQWDPVARYEKQYRTDGSHPPSIPNEFMSLVEIAIQDAHKGRVRADFPTMRPDICIANYYGGRGGRLSIHQDCDESFESLKRGSPVVSISIGESADFWYGHTRDEINNVRLDSGDVLIFGGKCRLYFHGVKDILSETAPMDFLIDSGFAPGRLNLTLREY